MLVLVLGRTEGSIVFAQLPSTDSFETKRPTSAGALGKRLSLRDGEWPACPCGEIGAPAACAKLLHPAGVQACGFDGMPLWRMAITSEKDGKHAMAPAKETGAPRFAKDFPDDPQLQALVRAFEAGRYDEVRREAPELAARASDPQVAGAALELRRRLDPDPLARNILLAAIGLLVVLLIWSFSHHH